MNSVAVLQCGVVKFSNLQIPYVIARSVLRGEVIPVLMVRTWDKREHLKQEIASSG